MGVSVSGVVYDSVRDKLDPGFEDLGPQQVKNIAEPIRAYRVLLDPEATGTREAPQVAIATRVHEAKRVLTICSGTQRQGTWRVPQKLRVVTVMGGHRSRLSRSRVQSWRHRSQSDRRDGGDRHHRATSSPGRVRRRRYFRSLRGNGAQRRQAGSGCAAVAHHRGRGHGCPGNLHATSGGDDESRCKRKCRSDRSSIGEGAGRVLTGGLRSFAPRAVNRYSQSSAHRFRSVCACRVIPLWNRIRTALSMSVECRLMAICSPLRTRRFASA